MQLLVPRLVINESALFKRTVRQRILCSKNVPDLFTNLFSITKALDNGWNISNKGVCISLEKDDFQFCFDKTLRTDSGAITVVEMVPKLDTMHITLESWMSININKLHLLLGHACKATLQKTAQEYGFNLKGSYMVCSDCAIVKVHQKNMDKVTNTVSTKPGEH